MKRKGFILLFAGALLCWGDGWSQSSRLLTVRSASGETIPVTKRSEWEKKRQQILEGMQQAMGRLPVRKGLPAFNMQGRDTLRREHYTRYTIRFTGAPGEIVPAYLYIPANARKKEKFPAMLVLHGTGDPGKELVDGRSGLGNRAHAMELANRGYVVIAPDYPSMGELKDYDFTNDRYESGTMKAIFNHMRCIDLLQSLPHVDRQRIGVIGHSLGGHNAMFVGAFDERLKVIVASCGWTLMKHYNIGDEGSKRYGGRLGPWAQERYMPLLREKYQLDDKKFPFDFDSVIAALAPRAFFSNSPVNDSNFDVAGVREGIESSLAVYRFLGAPENLQVRYPEAGHDFPPEVRQEAYRFIDNVLEHTPVVEDLEQR